MQGIVNVGNTCGIGTWIQCIGHCKILRNHILEQVYPEESLIHVLGKILYDLWVLKRPVVPRDFVDRLYSHIPIFVPGEQHDICEIWMFLWDHIAKETHCSKLYESWKVLRDAHADSSIRAMQIESRLSLLKHNKNNASTILDLIQGQFISQVECNSCHALYHNFEPFTAISIQIDDTVNTVIDCLHNMFREDQLHEWKCDKCSQFGGTKITRIWKLPRVLSVQLKRYTNDNNNTRKLKQALDIPHNMVFPRHMVLDPNDNRGYAYALKSIALHHGSLFGGHYTSLAKHDDQFVHFDDINVQTVDNISEILPIVQKNAYMLIYEEI